MNHLMYKPDEITNLVKFSLKRDSPLRKIQEEYYENEEKLVVRCKP